MAYALHIDGLSNEPIDHVEVKSGDSLKDFLDRAGATWRLERVPDRPPVERKLMPDAEEFISTYEYEEAGSVLAVVRRYGWLDAEEFDTTEEAKSFIEGGEHWGSLAGEAIVDRDQVTVLD